MNRTFKWLLHLGLIAVFGLPTAFADSNTAANQLFVESAKLLLEAKQAPVERQLELYQRALANLDKIVAQYPSSDLAVKLVSGQAIGKIDRTKIEREVKKAICYQQPEVECITLLAFDLTQEINSNYKDAYIDIIDDIWGLIAVAQAEVGDKQAARETIKKALDACRFVKSCHCRVGVVAMAQAETGDKEGARATIKESRSSNNCSVTYASEFSKALLLRYRIKAQEAIGDKEGARAILKTLQSSDQSALFLGITAMIQAEIGDKEDARVAVKEALDAARSIKPSDRWLLGVIAVAQAETGDKQGAQATVKEALDAFRVDENKRRMKLADLSESAAYAQYLGLIAMAQAKIGDNQGAQATLKETDLLQRVAAARLNLDEEGTRVTSENDVFAAFVLANIAAEMAEAQRK